MSLDFTIRPALVGDMEAVRTIYAHYVETSFATFEEEAPSVAEMVRRFDTIMTQKLPYLVAENEEGVIGFAYVAPFRVRSAFRYTVEDSIYVSPAAVGRGIGSALLSKLGTICSERGYRQMVAVIGDSANNASIKLHTKAGFERAGTVKSAGFKFGRWVDSVIMQKALGDGDTTLPG